MNFNLPGVDGKNHSLSDYNECKGAIVIFTCNHCPYAIAYEDRIINLHKTYEPKGYPVIAICSNDAIKYPQDSFDEMIQRAEKKNFPFPYLHDESQEIAQLFQATKTPHAFLLQRNKENWDVIYNGAIDDNWEHPDQVKQKYIEQAIQVLDNGIEMTMPETTPVGCSIKWRDSSAL